MSTAVCLAATGLLVAWLAPHLLRWQGRRGDAPRLAVSAWFVAASVTVASWLLAAIALTHADDPIQRAAGTVAGVAIAGRLAWSIWRALRDSRRRQRAHLATAQIVGHHDQRLGVLVIDAAEPLVYCVPTGNGAVVMSSAARAALTDPQTRAVLAHERTHLDERHHLVVTIASALHTAFPMLGLFSSMGSQVARLLEMRADDAAARAHGRDTVLDALAALCLREVPAGALGAHGPTMLHRAVRLANPRAGWRARIGAATTWLTLAFLLAAPFLAATLPPCPHPLI